MMHQSSRQRSQLFRFKRIAVRPTSSSRSGGYGFIAAADLENFLDYSKLATAAMMKVKAQNLLSSVTVKPEEIKDVMIKYFNGHKVVAMKYKNFDGWLRRRSG